MEKVATHLGKVLHKHGNKYICEFGVGDKKTSILWEELNELFLGSQRTSVNFMPASESVSIKVVSITGEKINFEQKAPFVMSRKKKDTIYSIYSFVVKKIIDRQMSELVTALKGGNRVSFKSFDMTSNAIYRKKFFGGHDIIDCDRIVGCDFYNGEFVIKFIDNKGSWKQKDSGRVADIPNIHLAQALLLSIAKSNLEARKKGTRESFKK
ncbi:hypothetical protein ACFLUJ_06810 [Chloroflexota bacterium]